MASIRKMKGKYYSRIQWRDESQRMKEKLIPLKTNLKYEAVVRNNEVETVEDTIKQGEDWSFAWMHEGGKKKLIRRKLQDTIEEYHAVKNINGIRHSTIERSECALKTLTDILGKSFAVQSISESHIQEWKEYWVGKHKPHTINLHLSKIRALLNWCYKKKYIRDSIQIEKVKADEKPVSYLSDSDMIEIMRSDTVDNHFKRSFLFYLMTGCRKTEPFQGTISGNWLIIEPDKAKSHRTREIHLSPELMGILHEMRNRYYERVEKYGYKPRNVIMKYTKEFKKACRSVGIENRHLHNLRDTYAVRRWAMTGDIHLVAKEIGHASVTMTEKYANFNLRRLMADFPTLGKHIERRIKKPIEDTNFVRLLNDSLIAKNGY